MKKINLSNVMKMAWKIARKAEEKYGNKASEYFAASLKRAWDFAKEDAVIDEQQRVKNLMRSYQDDIKGRWNDIKAVGIKKAKELGLDEKQEFQAIVSLKTQFDSFVNWVPAYDDLERVKEIHQNMLNFIGA